MAKETRSNSSRLYVPEPPFRPGDTPDYSHIAVPAAHSPSRPDPLCNADETRTHATSLIRVLRFNGETQGDWVPDISAEVLRGALRDIALTRAMDERMFTVSQGPMHGARLLTAARRLRAARMPPSKSAIRASNFMPPPNAWI